ncbi:MAG: hypothetical protein NC093_11050 [Alistipes sp.]|nr:hypothetical protein [Alistipes sp.]
MTENNLREALKKCTKEELIKTIMKASKLTYATFPWSEMVAEIRLDEIGAKIDANLTEGEQLTNKFSEMAKAPHNYSCEEILKIRIALAENHKKWEYLNSKYDRIFKELYGQSEMEKKQCVNISE